MTIGMESTPASERLAQQIAFILEIDKLKGVLRRTYLLNGTRHENSAEHSWHLALMAMLLAEHANESVDVSHVIKMVLVHDLVEIDAGDTYCYDAIGTLDQAEREAQAAERLFGLLPAEQGLELHKLWIEFEDRATPEARFAAALDRLMPLLHNYHTEGRSWREHGITQDQVVVRNHHIADGSQALWQFAQDFIQQAVAQGFLPASTTSG
ncbi:MAG: HD domain-containing protein [Abitibacteriaceae bacterium]|nr:HD domain-containing protein [Abditibacteriaceae bacterium]